MLRISNQLNIAARNGLWVVTGEHGKCAAPSHAMLIGDCAIPDQGRFGARTCDLSFKYLRRWRGRKFVGRATFVFATHRKGLDPLQVQSLRRRGRTSGLAVL